LAVNLDENRMNVILNPWFYGAFVSEGTSKRVHLLLVLLIWTHVVCRTLASALLFVTNPVWWGALVGAEMGMFLAYKAVRSDFQCWLPGTGPIVSFLYRVFVKLMCDYTGLPHLRHPKELGGAYYALTMALNPVVCLLSGWAYTEYYVGPTKLDRIYILLVLGVLVGLWMAALFGVLFSIERAYIWTFFSLETSRASIVRFFRENEGDDDIRTEIFNNHELLWASIRPEVRAWVRRNFLRWKTERKEWLTAALIAKLPDDFLPAVPLR
jgi:hypothetical protein